MKKNRQAGVGGRCYASVIDWAELGVRLLVRLPILIPAKTE